MSILARVYLGTILPCKNTVCSVEKRAFKCIHRTGAFWRVIIIIAIALLIVITSIDNITVI